MTQAVHYAHDGTYLIGFGTVGGAVFPDGALIELGYPPGWPLTSCPSPRHRWNIKTCTWDEEPISTEEAWAQVRYKRDQLIAATDWRIFAAAEAGAPLAKEWQAYRQALRDVTTQKDPAAVVWPVAPHE
ncbi:hypothetical protein HNP33_003047 [Comamonas odontotermitis]|uniref:Phage tail assembly chaperone-like domain-containing protein n=1 Tax=Comamonas odontotermitis TaxID=379895 RepID=A0ABR6RIM3_9BURK|nr:hypothetical protein [Comamonas odontotermitis]